MDLHNHISHTTSRHHNTAKIFNAVHDPQPSLCLSLLSNTSPPLSAVPPLHSPTQGTQNGHEEKDYSISVYEIGLCVLLFLQRRWQYKFWIGTLILQRHETDLPCSDREYIGWYPPPLHSFYISTLSPLHPKISDYGSFISFVFRKDTCVAVDNW